MAETAYDSNTGRLEAGGLRVQGIQTLYQVLDKHRLHDSNKNSTKTQEKHWRDFSHI